MPTQPQNEKTECRSLKSLMREVKKKADFQRVQCIFLRERLGMKAAGVAEITGLKEGTVRKIWSNYDRSGEQTLIGKARGGRRNSYLSREEEKLFLRPFFKKAEQGDGLAVVDIHEAYENLVGKKVPKSTIYRLLSRHGWRREPSRKFKAGNTDDRRKNMHEYWIEGCSQSLQPDRTGNISQQWLTRTLSQMAHKE